MIQNHNNGAGEKEISDPDIKSSSTSSSLLPSDAESPPSTSDPNSLTSTSDSYTILPTRYSKILVPHDNTEMSDKALGHAIYLANATGAEIVILFVLEKIEDISDSSLVASVSKGEAQEVGGKKQAGIEKEKEDVIGTSVKPQTDEEKNIDSRDELKTEDEEGLEADVTVSAHGEAKKMIVEKLNLCKSAGATGQVSYKLSTGRSVEDEIIDIVKGEDADLIVMTSGTISASIRSIGSTARKVIDNVNVPVLIICR